MTVRLSVARSVPILPAAVTAVSDSPVIHSILLHSTSFYSVPHSAPAILPTASRYIFTLVVFFFVSSTVAFVGTEVDVRDLVVSCSGPRSCFNLWPGAAAEEVVDGVLQSCDLLEGPLYYK